MLLAEQLALVAVKPDTGRHARGGRDRLNACLAGLLVAELMLDGAARPGEGKDQVVPTDARPSTSTTLAAAAQVTGEKGLKLRKVLEHMSRGIDSRLGHGTWHSVVFGLANVGILGPARGGVRSKNDVANHGARDEVIARLRSTAASDRVMEPRTALVLNMTGPASLLEVVAPDRSTRKHARTRIDHALDSTDFESVGRIVRWILSDAQAASAAGRAAGG